MNQPKEYNPEVMNIGDLAGEWYVMYRFDDGSGIVADYFDYGYLLINTYNDAENNSDSLWISDYLPSSAYWNYAVKVECDPEKLTFSSPDSSFNSVIDNPLWARVIQGKIFQDAVTLPSTTIVDSIYFKVRFSDLPHLLLHVSGYRRTGFLEDEPNH